MCVWWLKSTSRIMSMCHNRLHKETCNLIAGHHMEMYHGFMGMTQKWCSRVPVQQPLIFDPHKGNTNLCKKNTPVWHSLKYALWIWPAVINCEQKFLFSCSATFTERCTDKYPTKWWNDEWTFHYNNAPAHYALALRKFAAKNGRTNVPHPIPHTFSAQLLLNAKFKLALKKTISCRVVKNNHRLQLESLKHRTSPHISNCGIITGITTPWHKETTLCFSRKSYWIFYKQKMHSINCVTTPTTLIQILFGYIHL